MNPTAESLKKKLLSPPGCIGEKAAEMLVARLSECAEELRPNVSEWIEGKPFSDIRIHDKYCLNAVLKIRGNPTSSLAVANAILALDAYAKDASYEHLIWQMMK